MNKRTMNKIILRTLSILCAVILCCAPAVGAYGADTDSSGPDIALPVGTVSYVEADGVSVRQALAAFVNSRTTTLREGGVHGGWYAVKDSVTINERIRISGNVNLILCDGGSLDAPKGITSTQGNNLTIWQQQGGSGKLTAGTASPNNAAIGGTGNNSGRITINGGNITAAGSAHSPAIGGGWGGSERRLLGGGCDVVINGGTVKASVSGSSDAAAIGSAYYGVYCYIAINGGNVSATAGSNDNARGAAIGSGSLAKGADIRISGGNITVTSRKGAGIGSGSDANVVAVSITGGNITATSGKGAGIGGGVNSDHVNVEISGGKIDAKSLFPGRSGGIGAGWYNYYGEGSGYDTISTTLSYNDETKDSISITASKYKGLVRLENSFLDKRSGDKYGPVESVWPPESLDGTILVATDEADDLHDWTYDSDQLTASYAALPAKVVKRSAKTQTIKWDTVVNADSYDVYTSQCGKNNKMKLVRTVAANEALSYKLTGLKKGRYYKSKVIACMTSDSGQKKPIAESAVIYSSTTGGKYTDVKSVKLNKTGLKLSEGRTVRLKASAVSLDRNKKIKKYRGIRFASADPAIASVDSRTGVITGKAPGATRIYAYAQNGAGKALGVTVQ